MKNILICTFAILLSVTTVVSSAYAGEGTETGGGGDVAIFENGEVVLADPFLSHDMIQPNNPGVTARTLSPEVRGMIKAYKKIIEQDLLQISGIDQASDILNLLNILSDVDSVWQFHVVHNETELLKYCDPKGSKSYKSMSGVVYSKIACTIQNRTYIVEPLLMSMSGNLKNVSLLLIHEVLTSLTDRFGSRNYQAIAQFTTGLETASEVYKRQKNGNFVALSSFELKSLSDLYRSIEALEYRDKNLSDDSFRWKINPLGGRVYDEANVDESAEISFGNIILSGMTIGARSKILGFQTLRSGTGKVRIGPGSLLNGSKVMTESDISIGESVRIERSNIKAESKIEIDRKVVVEDSKVKSKGHLKIQYASYVGDSELKSLTEIFIGSGALLKSVSAQIPSLSIGSDNILRDLIIQ